MYTTGGAEEQEEQPRTMSMVIASDAPTSIQLAAQEFANRLAYYSDGELEISLSASDQLDAVLTGDFSLCLFKFLK